MHDVNFVFPIRELENDLVRLTPFLPEIHAPLYVEAVAGDNNIHIWSRKGPFVDATDFTTNFLEPVFTTQPDAAVFAIFDKTKSTIPNDPKAFAGIIGYIHASATLYSLELGGVVIFPAFQRTHVASNAIGLLLIYALDVPNDDDDEIVQGCPGMINSACSEPPVSALGLRRIVWRSNTENPGSIKVAERMGFTLEGRSRWVFPARPENAHVTFVRGRGRRGLDVPGFHVATLGLCWDEWEDGVREKTLSAMQLRR